ncbi:MAG: SAM-dependent chlorinase/fluorinase [Dehalococcoidales bacterium]|nr:SAM-dependent chlorinase/fluorinase [Dehalococcoidales bacterium]
MKKNGLVWLLLFSMILALSGLQGCSGKQDVNMPVVLLTDFGIEDYRVPQFKGIIYGNNPAAIVVDASHSVPSFDIPSGAFILNIAAREFPEHVVFVAVIAPYVQKETRYLVLTTVKHQIFVLPDNGLLTHVIQETDIESMYQVTNQELFDRPINELAAERIQGRIGALIASGYPAQDVGAPLKDFTTLDVQKPGVIDNKLLGTIVYIDHFGNAITNIPSGTAGDFGLQPGDTVRLKSKELNIPVKYGTIYSDVPQGKEVIFVNNNLGLLQLSINLGNFCKTYNIEAGARIEITR